MKNEWFTDYTASQRSAWGLSTGGETQGWMASGLCSQTDPESFFPERGGSTRAGKKICLGCPVRQQCLDYALDHDERFGIWGGYSERERRRLKRGEDLTPTLNRGGIPHSRGLGS